MIVRTGKIYNKNKIIFLHIYISVLLLFVVLIIGLTYIITGFGNYINGQVPKAKEGILDLTSWNFEKNGAIKLSGEWEFYWKQLLTPGDFERAGNNKIDEEMGNNKIDEEIVNKTWINIPNSWNKSISMGNKLSEDGYATFHLKILLSEKENNNNADDINKVMGIKLPAFFTSHKLWINGVLYKNMGDLTGEESGFYPVCCPDVVYFPVNNHNIDIVIQVADFITRRGGIWQPFILGTENHIKNIRERSLFLDVCIFSCLLTSALYYIFVYIASPKKTYMLYLGILSLILSIRALLFGEMYIIKLFPTISQRLLLKLQYMTLGLGFLFSNLYIENMFPDNLSKKIYSALKIAGISCIAFVMLVPVNIISRYISILHIIVIIAGMLYTISMGFPMLNNIKRENILFFGSTVILYASIISDILYYNETIPSGYTSLGFLIFIIVHSALIFIRNNGEVPEVGNGSTAKRISNLVAERNKRMFIETLDEFSKSLTTTLDINEVLDKLLVKLESLIPFDCGLVMLKEEEGEVINPQAYKFRIVSHTNDARGKCPYAVNKDYMLEIPENNRFIKHMFEKARPIINGEGTEMLHPVCMNAGCGKKAFLAVPMVNSDGIMGIIVLQSRERNAFSEYDAEILLNSSAQSKIAIRNAKLFTEVKKLARIDDLTKLINRRYFFELAGREFNLHKRYKNLQPMSLIMLDVDDFKQINDTYGHYIGDSVLKAVADICKESLRETDIIGRYGGEEYVVLLPHTGVDEAKIVAERISSNIVNKKIFLDGRNIQVTVSMGIAVMDDNTKTLDELLQKADAALYMAKKKGKNCIVVL